MRDLGLWVQASPKVLHCGFKQILDSLLGTGSTQFEDQRNFEYYYNCVGEGGAIECGCLGHFRLSLRFRLDMNIFRKRGKLYFLRGCVCVCDGV